MKYNTPAHTHPHPHTHTHNFLHINEKGVGNQYCYAEKCTAIVWFQIAQIKDTGKFKQNLKFTFNVKTQGKVPV